MQDDIQGQGAEPSAHVTLARLPLRAATRARLGRIGDEFLVEILRRELQLHPRNAPALAELGQLYTSLGRLEEGLAADLSLLALEPENPVVHYNLACSYALLGRRDDALGALEAAVQRGYDDGPHLAGDEDLVSLHSEPRFRALLDALDGSGTDLG